jgi:hypothetical protein
MTATEAGAEIAADATTTATHVAGETVKTTATTVGAGTRIMTVISEAWAQIIGAAAGAMEAMASIPYVGPILAVAAAAAVIAAGVGLIGRIAGGFRAGGWTGASADDEVAGPVHRNEYVVAAPQVRAMGGPSGVERALRMQPAGLAYAGGGGSPNRRGRDDGLQVNFLGYQTAPERRDRLDQVRGDVRDLNKRMRRKGL